MRSAAEIKQNEEARDAWVLRAGAELWKSVVTESDKPAQDTQNALAAVRLALDCARRLRYAHDISEPHRNALEEECERASQAQAQALRQWGKGRGLNWGAEWGMQWGETLSSEGSQSSSPDDAATPPQAGTAKPAL